MHSCAEWEGHMEKEVNITALRSEYSRRWRYDWVLAWGFGFGAYVAATVFELTHDTMNRREACDEVNELVASFCAGWHTD